MKTSAFTSIVTIFCLGLLVTFTSCSNKKEDTTNSTSQTLSDTASQAATSTTSTSGIVDLHLCTLWIESSAIKVIADRNDRRILLKFFVDNSDSLTLHGWQPKFNLFDNGAKFDEKEPDLELKRIRDTSNVTLKIDRHTYFGNLVISDEILDKIGENPKNLPYVVFFPEKIEAPHQPGKFIIQYILGLTDNNVNPERSKFHGDDELGIANPTPPRNYGGN